MSDTQPTADREALFFEPGKTYSHGSGPYRAPELATIFRCVAVAKHPSKGELRAFGFERNGAPGSPWSSAAFGERSWGLGWSESGAAEGVS